MTTSHLCIGIGVPIANFIEVNKKLVRVSFVENGFSEDDFLVIFARACDHPSIEIIQIADSGIMKNTRKSERRIISPLTGDKKNRLLDRLTGSIESSMVLKKLEIRRFPISEKLISKIFKALGKN